MDSLSSFHTPQSPYTRSWFSLFFMEQNVFLWKIYCTFLWKVIVWFIKIETLEFNVVLGSMLKILWMMSLAIKRSSVGWNHWEKTEVLPIFTMLTTFQLGIGKAPFLSHLSQLWLFLVLIAEREGIAKVFIWSTQEVECMLYVKENLNSRFCTLTLLTGAEVQLSIQNALSLMLVYCVLLKCKTSHPFFSTNWYLFHQIPYISSPVFRPSYGMNKITPDVSGPFRSLVQIWLYRTPILIWCLNTFCRFLSL